MLLVRSSWFRVMCCMNLLRVRSGGQLGMLGHDSVHIIRNCQNLNEKFCERAFEEMQNQMWNFNGVKKWIVSLDLAKSVRMLVWFSMGSVSKSFPAWADLERGWDKSGWDVTYLKGPMKGTNPSVKEVRKIFGIMDPLPPLVRILVSSLVLNPCNLPYYVCFWANPLLRTFFVNGPKLLINSFSSALYALTFGTRGSTSPGRGQPPCAGSSCRSPGCRWWWRGTRAPRSAASWSVW